jgi:UPF0716 protein FxsA
MSMLARLVALFLITPVVELFLLVKLDGLIGFWPTVGLIILTGLVGATLARREGLTVWRRFHERIATGGLPGKELMDGLIILVSGALLVTPGVLTDIAGLVGLLPLTRAAIRRLLLRRMTRAAERGALHIRFAGIEPDQEEADSANGMASQWRGQPRPTPRHADDESSDR